MKNQAKFPVLFSLYIAQSIPMSFFSTVVPVIMRQENYSLESIGLLQLVKLPWIIKFLWAPYIDNNSGTRRQIRKWIVTSELFYAIIILSIGFLSLETNFSLIIVLVIMAFVASATQDIATDIYAIRILKPEERGLGNSMQSAGSFTGSLVGTGVLLVVYSIFGWNLLLWLLAAFVVFSLAPVLLYNHPAEKKEPAGRKVNIRDVFMFFSNSSNRKHLLLLVFFYSGLIGILAMLKPFLVDLGYGTKEIGLMSGIAGTVTAALSAVAGGIIIKKAGRKFSFYLFGLINIAAALYFTMLTLTDNPATMPVFAGICLLWGAYGLSTVVIYTTSMDKVRKDTEGSDFTIQIAVTHLSSLLVAVLSGKTGDAFGYRGLFMAESALAFIALLLIFVNYPLKKKANE